MIDFNHLTIDNVGYWPRPVKFSVVIALSVFLMCTGYWFIVGGDIERYTMLKTQEFNLRNEFERIHYQASTLQASRDQLQTLDRRFSTMRKQFSTQHTMPGLLDDISKTGTESGLIFESFIPLSEVQQEFYIELPIKITVLGSYHQLAEFMNRVACMSRIVTWHDFVLERASTPRQMTGVGELLAMKITAKAYRYLA